jgi:hypothetical protein
MPTIIYDVDHRKPTPGQPPRQQGVTTYAFDDATGKNKETKK